MVYKECATVEDAQKAIQLEEGVQNNQDLEVEPQPQPTESPLPRCSNCFNIGHRRTQWSKPASN